MAASCANLHDVRTDERVCIRTILFDLLRQECAALGLHAGQCVRVRAASAGGLLVELAEGRTVALRREWAPFIEVEPDAPGGPVRAAA